MVNWWDTKKMPYAVGMDVLNYDMGNLVKPCQETMSAGADYFHFDVQDGHYGPLISVGSPVVEGIRRHFPDKVIVCHMLVLNPERFVEQFAQSGCDCFVFQIEKTDSSTVGELIAKIRDSGMKVGVGLQQDQEVSSIKDIISEIDMVHISCGDPCDDEIEFNPAMLDKVAEVRKMNKKMLIEVEGNVTSKEMAGAVDKGANLVKLTEHLGCELTVPEADWVEAGWPSDPEARPWFKIYIVEDSQHSTAAGNRDQKRAISKSDFQKCNLKHI
ncbi:hypothetical protein ACHWQZ_G007087 [Mnemiopsis leidyi]